MSFEFEQVVYKWQWGDCLTIVDNLYAISKLFKIPIEDILWGREAFKMIASAV